VKTQYGFHIIKVLDRETAHTKSFEEVRDSILQTTLDQKVNTEASDISNQMAAAVRQSDRQSLDDLAKKFHLEVGDAPAASMTDAIMPLGNSPELHQTLFSLRLGELSQPIQIDSGFVIITPKNVSPAHQATLAEVHDQALADYQHEKSLDLARSRAEELSKRVRAGEEFDKVASSLGLTVKKSDPFARNGSIPDVGTSRQLAVAFTLPVGQTGSPIQSGENWVVFRTLSHETPDPADLAKQASDLRQQLLQTKQNAAFEAFHTSLVNRLTQEGKLSINTDAVDRVTRSS
jgi:peptidyl-prolyl cis-trans isomerase D